MGQKHDGIGPDGFTFDPDDVVFPAAVFDDGVDVFIGQVDTAGEGHLAIDHHQLAMVAVVDDDIQDQRDPIERHAFDALGFQHLGIGSGQDEEGSQVVIHDSDFHALFDLFFHDLQHGIPHPARFDDEIL